MYFTSYKTDANVSVLILMKRDLKVKNLCIEKFIIILEYVIVLFRILKVDFQ